MLINGAQQFRNAARSSSSISLAMAKECALFDSTGQLPAKASKEILLKIGIGSRRWLDCRIALIAKAVSETFPGYLQGDRRGINLPRISQGRHLDRPFMSCCANAGAPGIVPAARRNLAPIFKRGLSGVILRQTRSESKEGDSASRPLLRRETDQANARRISRVQASRWAQPRQPSGHCCTPCRRQW